MSIESVMSSNYLILYRPLLLLSSTFPSIRVFFNELALAIRSQSIGASASASVLAMNIQGWFPNLGPTGLISVLSKGLSRVFSSTTVQKHQFCGAQPSLWSSSHICTWLVEKPYLGLYTPLSTKWCLCFLIHCLGLITAFLPRSKHLLNSCLQSPSAVTFEPKKIKSVTVSTFSSSTCHEAMGLDARILVFLNVEFFTLLFHPQQVSLVSLYFLPLERYHLHIWGCCYFSQQSWFQLVIPPAWNFVWYTLHIS